MKIAKEYFIKILTDIKKESKVFSENNISENVADKIIEIFAKGLMKEISNE